MAKNTFVFTLTPELREVLNLLAREAGKNKAESSYPEAILANGQVLSAANSYVSLKYQMGTDELGLMPVTFEKPVLIPIKGIKAILDSGANTEITISATATTISITKSKKKGKVQITALNGKEFPDFGKFDFNGIDKVSVGDFVDAVNAVKFSIAEVNPKPIYTGLFFQNDGNLLSFSAINGFQASLVKMPYQSKETFKISIPRTCLDTVLNAVSKKDRDDTLSIVRGKDNRHAAFFIGSRLVIRTRLIDGEPVDVNSFIKDSPHNVKVNKTELLPVLKSILTVKEDAQAAITLSFKFNEKEMEINYKANVVSLSDSVSMETEESADAVTIGVNVNYLAEAVKAITSQKIAFGFTSPVTPMILSDTDKGTDNKQIVVPIRIAN